MSETTTDAVAAAAADAVQADAAIQSVETRVSAVETPSTETTPTAEDTAAADAAAAEAAKKPERTERRIANLTRKLADADRAREAAERARDAAEALLATGKAGDIDDLPTPRPPPPATEIEARARQLREEERTAEARARIISVGVKEFGEKAWNERAAILHEFGATTDTNFMGALMAADNPTAIIAALSDDADALADLMNKPAAARLLALGRMDASFAKPAAKPLSGAPKPAAKVEGGGVVPAASLYDQKMSDAEFTREAQRLMPHLFGGRRKVA